MKPFVNSFSADFKQRLGQILIESHLISDAKLQVALYEQQLFDLRLGEILVAHAWVKPQTVDFFAEQWAAVKRQDMRYPLGQYFQAAGLLSRAQIKHILHNQQLNGHRFGDNAVLMGLIIPETLEYFLENLFPHAQAYTVDAKETFIQSPLDIRSVKPLWN